MVLKEQGDWDVWLAILSTIIHITIGIHVIWLIACNHWYYGGQAAPYGLGVLLLEKVI